MKRLVIISLCISCLFLSACQTSKAVTSSQLENSQIAEDKSSVTSAEDFSSTQEEIDLIQGTLESYLNDCWGYREDTHDLVFDTIVKLEDIEYHSFKIYSVEGEYSNTFAISLAEQKVYILGDTQDEWTEDKNPEPWEKW